MSENRNDVSGKPDMAKAAGDANLSKPGFQASHVTPGTFTAANPGGNVMNRPPAGAPLVPGSPAALAAAREHEMLARNEQPKKSRILQVFESSIGTCNYPFGNPHNAGKLAHFIEGVDGVAKYLTDDANEIQELELEISHNHPHIRRPVGGRAKEIDIHSDPLQAIKDAAVAEYIEKQRVLREAAVARGDMGQSDHTAGAQGNTGIGTTANVGTTASRSDPNSAVTPGNASVSNEHPDPTKAGVEPGAEGSVATQLAALRAKAEGKNVGNPPLLDGKDGKENKDVKPIDLNKAP